MARFSVRDKQLMPGTDITFSNNSITQARHLQDIDAWKQMQKARTKLFDNIFGQNQQAA